MFIKAINVNVGKLPSNFVMGDNPFMEQTLNAPFMKKII